MDLLKIDPESGLPEDLLSIIVFCFFPTSHRHFVGNQLLNIPYILLSNEVILTGSRVENLCLPAIVYKDDGKKSSKDTWADTDMMYNTGFYKDFYKTMSLEKDKDKPVFCKVKISDPGNEDFI